MYPYSRHTLNLKRGDRIVWLDKPCTVVHPNGRIEVYLRAGMRGRVVAIHDGVPPNRLDRLDSSLLDVEKVCAIQSTFSAERNPREALLKV